VEYQKEPGQTVLGFDTNSHSASVICKKQWWLRQVTKNKLWNRYSSAFLRHQSTVFISEHDGLFNKQDLSFIFRAVL